MALFRRVSRHETVGGVGEGGLHPQRHPLPGRARAAPAGSAESNVEQDRSDDAGGDHFCVDWSQAASNRACSREPWLTHPETIPASNFSSRPLSWGNDARPRKQVTAGSGELQRRPPLEASPKHATGARTWPRATFRRRRLCWSRRCTVDLVGTGWTGVRVAALPREDVSEMTLSPQGSKRVCTAIAATTMRRWTTSRDRGGSLLGVRAEGSGDRPCEKGQTLQPPGVR